MPSTDGSPMVEQILDRPAEERRAASEIGNGLAPSAPALIPGWRCLPGAVIRAGGEAGPGDLAAPHSPPRVAPIAFPHEREEANPEEACDPPRTMLRGEGPPPRLSRQPPPLP